MLFDLVFKFSKELNSSWLVVYNQSIMHNAHGHAKNRSCPYYTNSQQSRDDFEAIITFLNSDYSRCPLGTTHKKKDNCSMIEVGTNNKLLLFLQPPFLIWTWIWDDSRVY